MHLMMCITMYCDKKSTCDFSHFLGIKDAVMGAGVGVLF